jgi:hypothetical protein
VEAVVEEPEREEEEEYYNVFRTGGWKSPLPTLGVPNSAKKKTE